MDRSVRYFVLGLAVASLTVVGALAIPVDCFGSHALICPSFDHRSWFRLLVLIAGGFGALYLFVLSDQAGRRNKPPGPEGPSGS